MFDLPKHRVLIKGLHLIESNKSLLFSDGENDVLYSGTNVYGNRILGTIIGEDDDCKYIRYFHLLISDSQYDDFINQRVTLLSLLKMVESFFVVDFDYNYVEIQHSLFSFDEFPSEFLPLEDSYCPDFVKEPSLEYVVSLKGRKSDVHLIRPDDLNEVNLKFSDFLRVSTSFVNDLNLENNIYIEPYQTGSFQIKFKLDLNPNIQTSIFPVNVDKINEFLNEFYSYLFEKLPSEEIDVFSKSEISSENFKKLQGSLEQIYSEGDISLSELGVEQKILDTISYSVDQIKELNYDSSFDRIEFRNVSKLGGEVPISLINKDFIPSIEKKLLPIERTLLKEEVIEIDENPQTYKIQVYQFNINSGKGGCLISDNDTMGKVSLHVRGKENYKNTIFTRSMDEGKIVEIKGILKKVNGNPKLLTCQL